MRRELAEVLHSRVQSRLLILWYRLEEFLKDNLRHEDPGAARAVITDLREQIDNIREQEVRRLSHRLHPSIIRTGLAPALEVFAEEMAPLEVRFEVDPKFAAVDGLSGEGVHEVVRLVQNTSLASVIHGRRRPTDPRTVATHVKTRREPIGPPSPTQIRSDSVKSWRYHRSHNPARDAGAR